MEHSKKLDLSISAADLKRIEQILDYHFSRPERVALALTHSSWANEHGLGQAHNERLEFLGDAVLELCISWELFTRFPQAREGDMTRVRSQLVGTTSLAQRARETGIDQLLRLGRGEEQQGGQNRFFHFGESFLFVSNIGFRRSASPADGAAPPAGTMRAGLRRRSLLPECGLPALKFGNTKIRKVECRSKR